MLCVLVTVVVPDPGAVPDTAPDAATVDERQGRRGAQHTGRQVVAVERQGGQEVSTTTSLYC